MKKVGYTEGAVLEAAVKALLQRSAEKEPTPPAQEPSQGGTLF